MSKGFIIDALERSADAKRARKNAKRQRIGGNYQLPGRGLRRYQSEGNMLAIAPDSVPYYYGFITRENAELILWDRGCLDGMYLLRASHNRDAAFVLSVCQNKQVLHYRIIKDSNGMYHMHGLPVDKHVGPIEVLEQMQGIPCKLIIPCLKPLNVFMPGVNCGMTDDKLKEALQKKATEWGIEESELNLMLEDKENDVWKLILKTLHESESWFHGKISREEAEKRLVKGEYKDGKFLVRERDDRSFTLSLCHSEHVKHYKIDVLPTSEVGIQDGPRFENLISLVSHYSVFSDGLWCCLQYPCVNLSLELPLGINSGTPVASPTSPSPTDSWPPERRNSNSDILIDPATTTNAPTDSSATNATVPDLISDCSPPQGQPAFPLNRPIFSPIAENRNGSMNFHRSSPQAPADTSFRKFMMSKLRPPGSSSSNKSNSSSSSSTSHSGVKLKPTPPPKTTATANAATTTLGGVVVGDGSFRSKTSVSSALPIGDVSGVVPNSVFYKPLPTATGVNSSVSSNVSPSPSSSATSTPPSLPAPTKPPAPAIPNKNKPLRPPPAVPLKIGGHAPSIASRKLTPPPPPPLSVVGTTVISSRKLTPPSSVGGSSPGSGALTPERKLSPPPPVPVKTAAATQQPTIVEVDECEQSSLETIRNSVPPLLVVALPPSNDAVTITSPAISSTEVELTEPISNQSEPLPPVIRSKPLPHPRRNVPVIQKVRNSVHLEEIQLAAEALSPRIIAASSDRHSSPAVVGFSPIVSPTADKSRIGQGGPFNFVTGDDSTVPAKESSSVALSTSPPNVESIHEKEEIGGSSTPPALVKPVGAKLAWMSSSSSNANAGMTNLLAELKGHRVMGAGSGSTATTETAATKIDPEVEVLATGSSNNGDDAAQSATNAESDLLTNVCVKSPSENGPELSPPSLPEVPVLMRVKSIGESSEEGCRSRTSTCEPQYEEIDPDYASQKENQNDEIIATGLPDTAEDEEYDLEESQQESLVNEFVEECKWDDTREDASTGSSTTTRSFQRKPPWTKEESELHFNTIKRHRTGPMAINRQYLRFQEKLGLGNFGDVVKATFNSGTDEVPCAVKMLRKNNMSSGKESIMREARIMTKFDHPHIVRLLGVSEGEPFYLVMELAPLGPLSLFLRRNPAFAIDDILLLLKQVCQGMQYLESKQFVHRDLAARNVLLVNYSFVKISDFGMSKALGLHTDYYTVEPQGKLPLKWYAPECIYFFKFSTKSDVWSYGITLWEAMSYGITPYQGLTGREILKMFATNNRLSCPNRCPPEVFSIMMKCWEFRPEDRPTFSELLNMVTRQVEKRDS